MHLNNELIRAVEVAKDLIEDREVDGQTFAMALVIAYSTLCRVGGISKETALEILDKCPVWNQPIPTDEEETA